MPDDTVIVTRTYLSMDRPEQLRRGLNPEIHAALVEIVACAVDTWRSLYAQVGRRWHWRDRDTWTDAQLTTRLASENVRVFGVQAELTPQSLDTVGFLELERHADGAVEIAYIGLDERAFGRGLGRWLVAEATVNAWAWGATRVWLHTCTLDSDAALPNYLARGFVPSHTERYETTLE